MTTSIRTEDLKRRMHGAVEALKHELAGLRTEASKRPLGGSGERARPAQLTDAARLEERGRASERDDTLRGAAHSSRRLGDL